MIENEVKKEEEVIEAKANKGTVSDKKAGILLIIFGLISTGLAIAYLSLGWFSVGQGAAHIGMLLVTALSLVSASLIVYGVLIMLNKEKELITKIALLVSIVTLVLVFARMLFFSSTRPLPAEYAFLGVDLALVIGLALLVVVIMKKLDMRAKSFAAFALFSGLMLAGSIFMIVQFNASLTDLLVSMYVASIFGIATPLMIAVAVISGVSFLLSLAMVYLRQVAKRKPNNEKCFIIELVLGVLFLAAMVLSSIVVADLANSLISLRAGAQRIDAAGPALVLGLGFIIMSLLAVVACVLKILKKRKKTAAVNNEEVESTAETTTEEAI